MRGYKSHKKFSRKFLLKEPLSDKIFAKILCKENPIGLLLLWFCFAIECLKRVDNRTDVGEDGGELAVTVHVMVDALTLIPVYQRTCLVIVNAETFLDGLLVVV